jgi:tRNA wybutosine-synthesizing protein 3
VDYIGQRHPRKSQAESKRLVVVQKHQNIMKERLRMRLEQIRNLLKHIEIKKRTMINNFSQNKDKIINNLINGVDKSPAGKVDDGVAELVHLINLNPDLVTTSSCAGRTSVFIQGQPGRWTLCTHDRIDTSIPDDALHQLIYGEEKVAIDPSFTQGSLISLKFEPCILHVMASNLQIASTLLSTAIASAFRESGLVISHIERRNQKITVAIRTSTGLNVPVGRCTQDNRIISLVTLEYLRNLLSIANQKFEENRDKLLRLEKNLLALG